MADILAIAASGISIASLAIQLADSVQKLKSFCDNIKEAPMIIEHTLADAEILSLVLEEIAARVCEQERFDSRNVSLPASMMKSLNLCQICVRTLHTVAQELEDDIAKRKDWGALKALLKKGKIDRVKSELESAKTTLSLALPGFYHSIPRKETVDLKAWLSNFPGLSTTSGLLPMVSSRVEIQGRTSNIGVTASTGSKIEEVYPQYEDGEDEPRKDLDEGSDLIRAQSQASSTGHARRPNARYSIVFQVPIWLLSRRFEIRFRRAYGGWDHSLRTYKTIPSDAAILHYCIYDEIEKVQVLFESGLASPFESDRLGNTLLHYAVCGFAPKVTQLLLQLGADPDARNYGGVHWSNYNKGVWEISRHAVASRRGFRSAAKDDLEKFDKVIRLLVSDANCDPLSKDGFGRNVYELYEVPVETLSWLRRQEPLPILENTAERPIWVGWLERHSFITPEMIREVLPYRRVDANVTSFRDSTGMTFLHYIARKLGRLDWREIHIWTELLFEAVEAGDDLNALTKEGITPLFEMIDLASMARTVYEIEAEGDTRKAVKWHVIKWFRTFHCAKVDLVSYGRKEIALHEAWASSCRSPMFSLHIGPSPKDFDIELDYMFAWQSELYSHSMLQHSKINWLKDFWRSAGVIEEEEDDSSDDSSDDDSEEMSLEIPRSWMVDD